MRVVVLGAGFGGLELTTRLSEELGDDVDVVLIDQADGFVFGFSKLDVMFGRTTADAVFHPYADIVKPGVRFVQAEIQSIDPVAKRVETDAGTFEADILVVALGADLDPAATPGLVEGGHEFYTWRARSRLRDVLADFAGGRVVVGVTSTPFKCPPAPSETALLVHELPEPRRARAVRGHAGDAVAGADPAVARASEALLAAFAERGITWMPGSSCSASTRPARWSCSPTTPRCPTTSSSASRSTVRPPSSRRRACASTVDPGRPADARDLVPRRLRGGRRHERRHTEGGRVRRRTGRGRRRRDHRPPPRAARPSTYDGHGVCYIEFGDGKVGRVDVTFLAAPRRSAARRAVGRLAADKAEFGRAASAVGSPGNGRRPDDVRFSAEAGRLVALDELLPQRVHAERPLHQVARTPLARDWFTKSPP